MKGYTNVNLSLAVKPQKKPNSNILLCHNIFRQEAHKFSCQGFECSLSYILKVKKDKKGDKRESCRSPLQQISMIGDMEKQSCNEQK